MCNDQTCRSSAEDEIKNDGSRDERSSVAKGLDYMERGAHAGERFAMVYVARAYDTGHNLVHPEEDRSISRYYWRHLLIHHSIDNFQEFS